MEILVHMGHCLEIQILRGQAVQNYQLYDLLPIFVTAMIIKDIT